MESLTKTKTWLELKAQKDLMQKQSMRDLFAADPQRFDKFSLNAAGLFLDYSKNHISDEVRGLLCDLAEEAKLAEKREEMFSGGIINNTEKRAVLHTALRNPNNDQIMVDGENVMPQINSALQKMRHFSEMVRSGVWTGFSNKPITAIVNIGIGGSDLGPAMVASALKPYIAAQLSCHFVSNIDATHIAETLKHLDPETTLFIVASKTFTTQETLRNAETARDWIFKKAPDKKEAIRRHFVAVSARPERVVQFGIDVENVFPFWDFVGGRYSLWSAIGLSIALAIGFENFKELLAGAHAMDEHFYNAEFSQNMPIILAVLGIWHINFWDMRTQAVIPYDQYLRLLPAYLQQLDMESNGKHVDKNGATINYATAPVVWGVPGTNGQHAFHQLLLQGTQVVPIDFILPLRSHNPVGNHHLLLVANCLAQSQAMMQGKNLAEITAELTASGMDADQAQKLAVHKVIAGNVPNNVILTDKITPHSLGALLALYEHKIFVQGVIWRINSFDQWGVELGKQLANNLVPKLCGLAAADLKLDVSTGGLVVKYLNANRDLS